MKFESFEPQGVEFTKNKFNLKGSAEMVNARFEVLNHFERMHEKYKIVKNIYSIK